MARTIRTYAVNERPDIEVLVEGTWYPGELRQRVEVDGVRTCNVSWRKAVGETRLDTFPAERVRALEES